MCLEEDLNEIKSGVYFKITNYKRIKLIIDLQQWQGETNAETQVTTQYVCNLITTTVEPFNFVAHIFLTDWFFFKITRACNNEATNFSWININLKKKILEPVNTSVKGCISSPQNRTLWLPTKLNDSNVFFRYWNNGKKKIIALLP